MADLKHCKHQDVVLLRDTRAERAKWCRDCGRLWLRELDSRGDKTPHRWWKARDPR